MDQAEGGAGAAGRKPARELEDVLRHLFLFGVRLSVILMLAGLPLLALQPAAPSDKLLPPGEVLRGLPLFSPAAFLNLGVLVLLLIPAVGVLVCLVGFVQRRDRLFALITLGLLAVLAVGLMVGRA